MTWNEQWVIKVALDIGAYGVLVPQVSTKEEALSAVRAARYAPEGERGVGPSYAALRWGMTVPDYVAAANREVVVAIQVETPQGVENVDEILSVLRGPGSLPWTPHPTIPHRGGATIDYRPRVAD